MQDWPSMRTVPLLTMLEALLRWQPWERIFALALTHWMPLATQLLPLARCWHYCSTTCFDERFKPFSTYAHMHVILAPRCGQYFMLFDRLPLRLVIVDQGFCIGSAALVGLALFGAYVVRAKISVADSSILDPEVRFKAAARCWVYLILLSASWIRKSLQISSTWMRSWCAKNSMSFCRCLLLFDQGASCRKVRDSVAAQVFAGLLIGAMLPYWFSSMTMKSVGQAALAMVEEVRNQFNTIAGLMEGTARPDYRRCVEISTKVTQLSRIMECCCPWALACKFASLPFRLQLGAHLTFNPWFHVCFRTSRFLGIGRRGFIANIGLSVNTFMHAACCIVCRRPWRR